MGSRTYLEKGTKFGLLTVIGLDHQELKQLKNGYTFKEDYMLCKCDCGKEVVVNKRSLIKGDTKSCGCLVYKKTYNTIIDKGDYCEMLLNVKNINDPIITLIDKEDVEKIKEIRWMARYEKTIRNYYVWGWERRNKDKKERKKHHLHRFLINPPEDMQIDHINRNPLDNRKSNLRIVTALENANNKGNYKNNKSGYKYIHYLKRDDIWCCEIKRYRKIVFKIRNKDFNVVLEARNNFIKEKGEEYGIN